MIHALVFVLRSEFLALLFVHVHSDGKAFPESGIADTGHCGVVVLGVDVWVVLL